MDKLYNISKTAEILDVTPKTLRIWDKENKLKPILTSGGHRRYRESDINRIIGGDSAIIVEVGYYDGRKIVSDTIDWKNVQKGDIVLEGIKNEKYRTLTDVQGTYWEYFDENDGYYHDTSPEFCHWKVVGQKNCNSGKIMKIIYNK
jgi:hypothetical protein